MLWKRRREAKSRAAVQAEADAIIWFHSIDLGSGVTSAGIKSSETLAHEEAAIALPDSLRGLTVLDIGAWDGYFSFAAERRGADRVVALDHYAWALDHAAQRAYFLECHNAGVAPEPFERVPGIFDLERLPGRAGFNMAHRRIQSRVEPVVGDIAEMDLRSLGTFDIALFLGVLYHLEDPFRVLRRLRQVTKKLAVIETVCAVFPGCEDQAMWEFFPTDELNGDPSNWWAGNITGLTQMCRAAGFDTVKVQTCPDASGVAAPGHSFHYGRAIVHAIVE